MYKPSEKRKFNRVDNHQHCPASMKNKMQWFSFLIIMEHTANKMQDDKGANIIIIKDVFNVQNMLEFWR